jgi:hypothetical protein
MLFTCADTGFILGTNDQSAKGFSQLILTKYQVEGALDA